MMLIGPEMRKEINNEFQQLKYREFREWYFTKYDKSQLQKFKDEFYAWLEYSRKIVPFTQWFYGRHWIEVDKSISVIQDYHRNWRSLTGTVISSVHPPTVPLSIEGSSAVDPPLETTAFIKPTNTDPDAKIYKQNNYTNVCLNTIGDDKHPTM